MKFSELISEEIDIDVYDDYDERCAIAVVGPIKLTEIGKATFSDVLDMECEIYDFNNPYGYHAVVKTETEDKADMLRCFCLAAAGYVSDQLYKEWFLED